MALTRDVPFSKYGEDEATVAAAGIMYISQLQQIAGCDFAVPTGRFI